MAEGDNLVAAQTCGLTHVDLSSSPTRGPASVDKPAVTQTPAPVAITSAKAAIKTKPASKPAGTGATATTELNLKVAPTMVVNGPLRSGQRIYARNSDLIVTGLVSQGAEVIADGNIHIYGPLRGKAMAGAHGDTTARIFTTGLDAELVAIAGIYRVIDTKLSDDLHQRPALVQLEKDTLLIKPLSQ